ncbi:response regulator transcription factor [Paenibacillus chungangensis]|uniref:Response regulator n=1 Tax=Paenibacillus chungangensis TaxID=696535 RepID=A0ABW3HLB6_9BACL
MKILVVDDEKLIRDGIAFMLKHKFYHYENVYEFRNGEEALSWLEEEKADLIITDVRMPYVDGIELIRRVKKMQPSVHFIIISGYAEFHYAEQALNMGVSGYLLKPIQDQAFKETMDKVLTEIEEIRNKDQLQTEYERLSKKMDDSSLEQKLHLFFKTGQEGAVDEIASFLPPDHSYVLAIVHIDGASFYQSTFQYSDLDLIKFSLNNLLQEYSDKTPLKAVLCNHFTDRNQQFVLLSNEDEQQLRKQYAAILMQWHVNLSEYLNLSVTIGVSRVHMGLHTNLYREAHDAYHQRFIQGSNRVLHYVLQQKNWKLPRAQLQLLQKYMERQDLHAVGLILDELFANETYTHSSVNYIYALWLEIWNLIILLAHRLNVEQDTEWETVFINESTLNRFTTLQDMKKYIYSFISNLFCDDYNQKPDAIHTVLRVKQYIDNHYEQELSLNELAMQFAMVPSYFSTMFKKVCGQSFKKYVTDLRIAAAKQLLLESDSIVDDIAQAVGYADVQYFYRVFKQQTGMTPLQYRHSKKNPKHL